MKKLRARDLGIPFEGMPGPHNAITDVKDVAVGHTTLIYGEGKLEIGKGPVRTGVTAVRPHAESFEPVFAAWHSLNGCGEMTGTTWVDESGILYGPFMITNTFSVGLVRDEVIDWAHRHYGQFLGMPVVAETHDGLLNDLYGFHVKQEHVRQALEGATGGPVAEGNVGGGTGMICHDFKGGIGTASRILNAEDGGYTIGVLVQANYGLRHQLRIAGVPVGAEITDLVPEIDHSSDEFPSSSIIAVVATDCPLLPHQLKRLAKRISLGIARVGAIATTYSGDIFFAFSTAQPGEADDFGLRPFELYPDYRMNPLLEATIQASEEAVVNSLVAAETMVGIDYHRVYAIPHERLKEVLRKYNRLEE
jgi:L-aminopeptidase/D-esterase-like protein